MPWWDVTQFRTLQAQEEESCGWMKTVMAALKTEDHSYLESFTKGTNTHDKLGKPLLKTQTPMTKLGRMGKSSFWICMEQSNNLIWTSAASSCTTSSSAKHHYSPDLSYKHCLQTVLHHSTMYSALVNNGYVMKYQHMHGVGRTGWVSGSCGDWQSCCTR